MPSKPGSPATCSSRVETSSPFCSAMVHLSVSSKAELPVRDGANGPITTLSSHLLRAPLAGSMNATLYSVALPGVACSRTLHRCGYLIEKPNEVFRNSVNGSMDWLIAQHLHYIPCCCIIRHPLGGDNIAGVGADRVRRGRMPGVVLGIGSCIATFSASSGFEGHIP